MRRPRLCQMLLCKSFHPSLTFYLLHERRFRHGDRFLAGTWLAVLRGSLSFQLQWAGSCGVVQHLVTCHRHGGEKIYLGKPGTMFKRFQSRALHHDTSRLLCTLKISFFDRLREQSFYVTGSIQEEYCSLSATFTIEDPDLLLMSCSSTMIDVSFLSNIRSPCKDRDRRAQEHSWCLREGRHLWQLPSHVSRLLLLKRLRVDTELVP